MVGFFVALLSGILMSIQGVFNTEVTKSTSLWVTNCFVQLTALIVCLAAWGITDRTGFRKILEVRPWYLLLGGVIGAMITYTVITAISSLGPAKAVMFILIAQLLTACVIEYFGMFGVDKQPFSIRKVIGTIAIIGGIIVFKWK